MTIAAAIKRATEGWRGAAGLTILVVAFYLFTASRSTLWDRDEPRFSKATTEMVQNGQYLYPTLNGELRADKPILIYWLMALPVRLLGPTELACRFCAPLGIGAICLLLYALARKLLTHRAGLWAIVVFATTPLAAVPGTAATTDAVLLAGVMAILTIFVYACERGWGTMSVLGLGLAIGATALTKGPMVALPLMTLVVVWWFERKDAARASDPSPRVRCAHVGPLPGGGEGACTGWHTLAALSVATGIGLALYLAWFIPANAATHGGLWRLGIMHHVVDRMQQPQEHHGGGLFPALPYYINYVCELPYYLPVVLLGFMPWTWLLPAAGASMLCNQLGGRRGKVFLLAWILPTLVAMSLVATKLPHYILPLWPALALAAGGTLDAWQAGRLSAPAQAWLRRGMWLFVGLSAATGAGLVLGAWYFSSLELGRPALICALVLVGVAGAAAIQQARARAFGALATLLGGVLLLALLGDLWILPKLEEQKVSAPFARTIRACTPGDVPIVTCGDVEPSLLFYLGRTVVPSVRPGIGNAPMTENEPEPLFSDWAKEPRDGVVIIASDLLTRIDQAQGNLGLEKIVTRSGFNYANGRPYELCALRRGRTTTGAQPDKSGKP